jgi:uncharacterized protein (TIGR03067 family)
MKVSARLLLLIGLGMVSGCMREDLKTDEERIQGPWIVMSMDVNGKAEYVFPTVTFIDDRMDIKERNHDGKASFRLDATQSPKEIDLLNHGGSVTYGIYSIEGETLKICLAASDGQRPKEFTSKPRSGQTLMVLKRDKMNVATFKEQFKAKNKPPKETQLEQGYPPAAP